LPASTLTNVGITGNGRAFEYLLTILYSSSLDEEKSLASKIKHELDTTIKSFVQRSNDNYGKILQKYLQDLKKITRNFSKKYVPNDKTQNSLVKLVDYEPESKGLNKIISALLYEHAQGTPYYKIQALVKKMSLKKKQQIIRAKQFVSTTTTLVHSTIFTIIVYSGKW